MGAFYTKIAGVTFTNDDGTNRQTILEDLSEGDFLDLRDDSSPKYPEAIGVYDQSGRKAGNLPKAAAENLRSILDDPEKISECVVVVISVGSEDGKPLGCQIEVSHDDIEDDQHERYEREIERLDAEIKNTELEYKLAELKSSRDQKPAKSGIGVGCTIALLIVGGIIGLLLFNWMK